MPATKIPVIYSAATGRIRWWVVFDQPNESDANVAAVKPGKGEALLMVDRADYGDISKLQAHVTKETGITPTDDRYAVVDDKGDVVAAMIADPACDDAAPGMEMVKHAEAGPGWKKVGNVFTKPVEATVAANEVIP